MSRRAATAGLFVVNGAVIGAWVSQIPSVQRRFDLSAGEMGLLLLCMALAVIVAVPVAGQAVARRGSGPVALWGGVACLVAVDLPVLAPDPLLVAVALVLLGAASAAMDVAMNSHGVAIETAGGRPIMSSLHAGWALGGAAGAAAGAAGAAAGLDGWVTVALVAAVLAGVLAACAPRLGHGTEAEGGAAAPFRLPSRGVALLAALCLLVMMTEGAMADWSGIWMRSDAGAGAALAALAYAVFTAGMTAGRLAGDALNRRVGPVALLRAGALLTALPIAVMLVAGQAAVGLACLFLVGLGVANGVPLMFSAAGRQPGVAAGPGIAAVSSTGSIGFLIGPPVIGFLAGAATLPWALGVLVPAALLVLLLARRAAAPRRRPPVLLSDMDGVLVDSMNASRRAWVAWGEQHGIDGAAVLAANHGRPAREVIAQLVGPDAVEDGVVAVREAEIADADVRAFPGAADVLARGRVAVVTSAERSLAEARLRAAGLPVPEVLVTSDMVARGKPAPDPYLLAARLLGADPADCVVLEDAPAGVAAGRAAGMAVWAVTTTHAPRDLGGATRIARGLPELLARPA